MVKAWHRVKSYIRYDLREIINPSSLPNPPDYVPPEKLTWQERRQVIQEANRKYWKTWQASQETEEKLKEFEPKHDDSLGSELSQTAKAALRKSQGLKPLLHHVYETRARSYRDAVQQFVEGYKEGFAGQSEPVKSNTAAQAAQKQSSGQSSQKGHSASTKHHTGAQ